MSKVTQKESLEDLLKVSNTSTRNKSISKSKRTNVFSSSTRKEGLPAKSFTWILTIDSITQSFLSLIGNLPVFEEYVTSKIQRFYRVKDRERETLAYLNFLVTSDISRLYFIYPTRFFSRQICLQLIFELHKDILRYKSLSSILSQKGTISKEDEHFFVSFTNSWLSVNNADILFKCVEDSHKQLNHILEVFYLNFKSLIIKLLLSNRKGDPNPDHLRTDAFEVILQMIDQYSLRTLDDDPDTTKDGKGKVPFTTQIEWLAKNKKNSLILEETWGLDSEEDYLVSLDFDSSDTEESSSYKEKLMASIEEKLQENHNKDSKVKNYLVDLSFECLPKPFKELVALAFDLQTPLLPEEEILLIQHANKYNV